MDSADVEWLARMGVRAAIAEIRDQPPSRTLNEAEIEDVVLAMAGLLSEDDLYELLDTLEDPAATESELCDAARITFALVEELPRYEAGLLARLLVMTE